MGIIPERELIAGLLRSLDPPLWNGPPDGDITGQRNEHSFEVDSTIKNTCNYSGLLAICGQET
jgi:hypothetical protein